MQIRLWFAILGAGILSSCFEDSTDFLGFKEETVVTEQELIVHNCDLREWTFLSTLPPVSSISLKRTNCKESDFTQVPDLSNLHELTVLFCTEISSLEEFYRARYLKKLALGGKTISSLSSITNFSYLETLSLYNVGTKDLSVLNGLNSLREIESIFSAYNTFCDVESLPSLRRVSISNDSIINTISIKNSPTLQELELLNCVVQKVLLHNFPSLQSLHIYSRPKEILLRDLLSLTSLTIVENANLQRLELDGLLALKRLTIHEIPNVSSVEFRDLISLQSLCLYADNVANWEDMCTSVLDTLIIRSHVSVHDSDMLQEAYNLKHVVCWGQKENSFLYALPVNTTLRELYAQSSSFQNFLFLQRMKKVSYVDLVKSTGLNMLNGGDINTSVKKIVLDSTDLTTLSKVTEGLHKSCVLSIVGCDVAEDEIAEYRERGYQIFK